MMALPVATGVTTPVEETLAMVLLLLVHAPPAPDVSERVTVPAPIHSTDAPGMAPAAGSGLTVRVAVADELPQLPVRV
jgi:hypothetical protein